MGDRYQAGSKQPSGNRDLTAEKTIQPARGLRRMETTSRDLRFQVASRSVPIRGRTRRARTATFAVWALPYRYSCQTSPWQRRFEVRLAASRIVGLVAAKTRHQEDERFERLCRGRPLPERVVMLVAHVGQDRSRVEFLPKTSAPSPRASVEPVAGTRRSPHRTRRSASPALRESRPSSRRPARLAAAQLARPGEAETPRRVGDREAHVHRIPAEAIGAPRHQPRRGCAGHRRCTSPMKRDQAPTRNERPDGEQHRTNRGGRARRSPHHRDARARCAPGPRRSST